MISSVSSLQHSKCFRTSISSSNKLYSSETSYINRKPRSSNSIYYINTTCVYYVKSSPTTRSQGRFFVRSSRLQSENSTPAPLEIVSESEEVDEREKQKEINRNFAKQIVFHDLRRPHEWYPLARSMKRVVHLHVGPTNSGKTHSALVKVMSSKTGVYCGPLRLLAEQVFEKMNENGVPCNLVTGEKIIELDKLDDMTRKQLEAGGDAAIAGLNALYRRTSQYSDFLAERYLNENVNEETNRQPENNDLTNQNQAESMNDIIITRKNEESKQHIQKEGQEDEGHDVDLSSQQQQHINSRPNLNSSIDQDKKKTIVGDDVDNHILVLDSHDIAEPHLRHSPLDVELSIPPVFKNVGHVSCTVEMADVRTKVDCALIDEYQLIADRSRGWAWTRAILGVPARELHLCGDTSAIQLIKTLLEPTGDELFIHNYERLSPLKVAKHALGEYDWIQKLQAGDAVVVFSRKSVFQHKKLIESTLRKKVSVVYGALPPETRTQQAKKFNDPNSGCNILVATDAIGLGLNLNIGRIIFSTFKKFDGHEMRDLEPPEVRQIGGRAGRFNSLYPEGIVTSIQNKGIPFITHAFNAPVQNHKKAGLFPMFEHLELFERALAEEMHKQEQKQEMNQKAFGKSRGPKSKSWHYEPVDKFFNEKKKIINSIRELERKAHDDMDPENAPHDRELVSKMNEATDESPYIEEDSVFDPNLFVPGSYYEAHAKSTRSPTPLDSTPAMSLYEILEAYEDVASVSGQYFLCDSEDHKVLAQAIDHLPLSLREKYTFVMAPIRSDDPVLIHYFKEFASLFASGLDVLMPNIEEMKRVAQDIEDSPKYNSRISRSKNEDIDAEAIKKAQKKLLQKGDEASPLIQHPGTGIRRWEQIYKIIELYMWLSYRFEGFVDVEKALTVKIETEANIAAQLDIMARPARSDSKYDRGYQDFDTHRLIEQSLERYSRRNQYRRDTSTKFGRKSHSSKSKDDDFFADLGQPYRGARWDSPMHEFERSFLDEDTEVHRLVLDGKKKSKGVIQLKRSSTKSAAARNGLPRSKRSKK